MTTATDNVPAVAGGTTAIARPVAQPMQKAAEGRFENATQADIYLPRVQIYQGTPEEQDRYQGCNFAPGDLFEVSSREKLGANKFVVLGGFNEWIKFREPRGSGIEYRTRNVAEVPPVDLEWRESGDKKGPAVVQIINFAVLFQGREFPLLLGFKRTSIKAGKTLLSLEHFYRRNKGPGFYELACDKTKNDKGLFYVPRVRPLGDPPEAMRQLVKELVDSLSGVTIDYEMDEAEESGASS